MTGGALLIMASQRLAFALFCTWGLMWSFSLTALTYFSARDFMPAKGRPVILLFLSSLICSVYLLLAAFLNPLLVQTTWFFLILVPPCCIGSGIFEQLENLDPGESLPRVFLEALCLGLLIVAFSLIREPLGLGSLSLPGGPGGIFEFFSSEDPSGFLPVRIFSVSSGGLLLLGYILALFRYFRSQYTGTEDNL
jgi:Na+-translocating ferredoxin:NAD+ oxidoreductase RnfE subunit